VGSYANGEYRTACLRACQQFLGDNGPFVSSDDWGQGADAQDKGNDESFLSCVRSVFSIALEDVRVETIERE
jgi:hypothetical protein